MVVKTMPKKQKIHNEAVDHGEISKEVLVIAQEVEIVKSLACNDLSKRNRQLKRLRKWLSLRSRSSFPFTEEDFRRIWKGLYYTMWMSDKPLVQEDLAEQLGKLLYCFNGNLEASTNFFGAFLFTMYHQWFGVDQWRIDKFMMLVRRMLRYMFHVLKDTCWSTEGIDLFNAHMRHNVFADKLGAAGLTMHILDVFCEELAKVANGDINAEQVGQFIRPFVEFYCTQRDCKLTSHCRTRIFYHLLYQSTLGREYMEKYNAWKELGFPTASINDLEKMEETNEGDDDEVPDDDAAAAETSSKQLDPRAGNVDVYMPELPVDVACIIEEIKTFLLKNESNTKRRKQFNKLIEICKTFQSGEFPLGIKKMPRVKLEPKEEVIAEKIDQLDEVENELYGVGRKLKQLNKRKRRKLLKSLDFQDADAENFDKVIEQAFPQKLMKPRKRKARNQIMNGWIEEEIDEDLAPKKKKAKKVKAEKFEQNVEAKTKNEDPEKPQKKGTKLLHSNEEMSTEPSSLKQVSSQPTTKKKHLSTEKQDKTSNKEEQAEKDIITNDNAPATENEKPQKKAKKLLHSKEEMSTEPSSSNKLASQPIKKKLSGKTSTKEEQAEKGITTNDNTTVTENEKTQKIAPAAENAVPSTTTAVKSKPETKANEWDAPLEAGEVEYFIPSRKLKLKKANSELVLNPLAMKKKLSALAMLSSPQTPSTPAMMASKNSPKTPASAGKRVKIALKNNTEQKPSEYIRQVKCSPNLPYDANKKPGKGLLKPHSVPSPINPFYKKKIGLRLLNDTM